jgi:pSer/pThr/pTyr-binding forkhead associated (FHA) protein
MKFCRSCGSSLAATAPAIPAYNGVVGNRSGPTSGVPAYGPIGGAPGYAAPEPTVPPSMPPTPSPVALGMMPTSLASPAIRAPSHGIPGIPGSAMPAQATGPNPGIPGSLGSMTVCPRCGTQTPLGFAYCQQCGFHMQAAPAAPIGPGLHAPIDPHGGTLAADDRSGAAAAIRPSPPARPQAAATWGTAVLVNRDGSDGQRYALGGEYLTIGRAGADIAFDEDRFLARQHARIERGADGVVMIHPLDALNGAFRKIDAPVELVDGSTILLGREVLRYELVDPEETKSHALVRHGVALFGSPPRDPWGRIVQLVPSGGYRDVRHLSGEEIILGREEGDIVFRDDAFMSRRHAAVTWDGSRAQITDLGSSNGTFVRIAGPVALKHGDHVRMGDQLLRIELGR